MTDFSKTEVLLTKEDLISKGLDLKSLSQREVALKKREKILLLVGGDSSEREISLESGKCVQKALEELSYKVILFDTKAGLNELLDVILNQKPDCVFNALHGGFGENGCIQAFLNMLQIPYTHSGVLSSALAMNKDETKRIARSLNVDVPHGALVSKSFLNQKEKVDFDCVIKPNQEGSSVGVYILNKDEKIPDSVRNETDDKSLLIEEYIPGREFSVAVVDEGALGIIELVPTNGFYDYEHKYSKGLTKHVVPLDLLEDVKNKMMQNAYLMHKALGCKGVSRSDFRYDPQQNRVVFLELNANPGMTNLSLVPEMALQKGISYNKLVNMLVEKADFEK